MHTNKLYLPTITDTCIYIHTSYIFDNRSIDSKYRLEQMNKYVRISSTQQGTPTGQTEGPMDFHATLSLPNGFLLL